MANSDRPQPPTINVDATIHFDRFIDDDPPAELEQLDSDRVLPALAMCSLEAYADPRSAASLATLYLQDGDPGFPAGDVIAPIVAGGNGILAAEAPYFVLTAPLTAIPGQDWRFQLLWTPDQCWQDFHELQDRCTSAYFAATDTPFVSRITSQDAPGFTREFLAAWGLGDAVPGSSTEISVDLEVDEGRPLGTRWIGPIVSGIPA